MTSYLSGWQPWAHHHHHRHHHRPVIQQIYAVWCKCIQYVPPMPPLSPSLSPYTCTRRAGALGRFWIACCYRIIFSASRSRIVFDEFGRAGTVYERTWRIHCGHVKRIVFYKTYLPYSPTHSLYPFNSWTIWNKWNINWVVKTYILFRSYIFYATFSTRPTNQPSRLERGTVDRSSPTGRILLMCIYMYVGICSGILPTDMEVPHRYVSLVTTTSTTITIHQYHRHHLIRRQCELEFRPSNSEALAAVIAYGRNGCVTVIPSANVTADKIEWLFVLWLAPVASQMGNRAIITSLCETIFKLYWSFFRNEYNSQN